MADQPAVIGSVLVVDDDEDLRNIIGDLLGVRGVARRVLVSSLAEVERQPEAALSAELAIIDVNLGEDQPTGLDVSRWLRQHGFAGAVVFLTGHAASDPRVVAAAAEPKTSIRNKPISLKELIALVEVAP